MVVLFVLIVGLLQIVVSYIPLYEDFKARSHAHSPTHARLPHYAPHHTRLTGGRADRLPLRPHRDGVREQLVLPRLRRGLVPRGPQRRVDRAYLRRQVSGCRGRWRSGAAAGCSRLRPSVAPRSAAISRATPTRYRRALCPMCAAAPSPASPPPPPPPLTTCRVCVCAQFEQANTTTYLAARALALLDKCIDDATFQARAAVHGEWRRRSSCDVTAPRRSKTRTTTAKRRPRRLRAR
jgi:hypothetical protein